MPDLSPSTESLARTYRETLLNDVLPFWFPRCLDTEQGGYFSAFDRDGTLVDSDKSVWAQGRMSWMLLTLYNTVERRPEWKEWAESGLEFLERNCYDANGRMYFQVTREGLPIRQRRYAYSEAFAAIAYSAHARAASNDRAAHRAMDLFDAFTRRHFTPGLMPPKFTDIRPMIGLAPRMIALVTAQELRANLGPSSRFTVWIDRCIDEIRRWFYKPELRAVMETVGENGEVLDHFDTRTLNPGHAIEGAWFIMQEGRLQHDDELIRLGCAMLDGMWERGWDEDHGGLFYFRDVYGKPVQEYWHDMKFWWPHCETIIATLLAWRLTGDSKYAEWHRRVHEWSFAHFADPDHGEWFGYLHRDGSRSVTLKGNLWKSFFHLPRMLWMCGQILEKK